MIKSGYSMNMMNEKLQGELADALKQTSPSSKTKLIKGLRALDIDFSRSIGKAILIKSSRDSRLKDSNNVIIGVFKGDSDKKLRIVAYQPNVGPISETKRIRVEKPNGGFEWVDNFGDLSWNKWLSLMSSVYIINKNEASKLSSLGRDNFINEEPSEPAITAKEVFNKKPKSKSEFIKEAKNYIESNPDEAENGPSDSDYRKCQMVIRILDKCEFDSVPTKDQLNQSVGNFIKLAKEAKNNDEILDLYIKYVASALLLRGEYKFTAGEWDNARFGSSDSKLTARNLSKIAGHKVNFWDYR